MEMQLPLGLTFDDILLVPGYADFCRSDIDLATNITKTIKLSLPLVSAPMDTVTESELAIKLAELGGIGIIHRNLSVQEQADQVATVRKTRSSDANSKELLAHSINSGLLVGAAVGASSGFEERVAALVKAG